MSILYTENTCESNVDFKNEIPDTQAPSGMEQILSYNAPELLARSFENSLLCLSSLNYYRQCSLEQCVSKTDSGKLNLTDGQES